MFDRIFVSPVLRASDWPVHVHRVDVWELCERHGQNHTNVHTVTYDVIDVPLLRFGVHFRNAAGSPYLECRQDPDHPNDPSEWDHEHGECRIAGEDRDVLLIGELPAWWKPRLP